MFRLDHSSETRTFGHLTTGQAADDRSKIIRLFAFPPLHLHYHSSPSATALLGPVVVVVVSDPAIPITAPCPSLSMLFQPNRLAPFRSLARLINSTALKVSVEMESGQSRAEPDYLSNLR